jgi:hypothetical protein
MHRRSMPRARTLTRFGRAALFLLAIAAGAFLLWASRELSTLIELVSPPPAPAVEVPAPPVSR